LDGRTLPSGANEKKTFEPSYQRTVSKMKKGGVLPKYANEKKSRVAHFMEGTGRGQTLPSWNKILRSKGG